MPQPEQKRPSEPDAARRDVLSVVAAVAVLFLLGVALDVYDRFEPLFTRFESGDELVGLLILALGGVATIAIRRARTVWEQTERREIADERLRALIAESPVVSYSWDPLQRRYLFISPQIEALFGVSAETHGAGWFDQIHPDDLEPVLAISTEADDAATTYLAEYRIIRPDGSVRWIHDESHYHHPGPDGRPTLAQGVMFDITERVEAETRAAEAEERYRTLVERVPAIAYAWDTAFAPGTAPADYISPQIEQLVGVSAQEWLDDPTAWADRVHPHDLERVTAAWDTATAIGSRFTQEYRLRTSRGDWLWVRDDANPVGPGVREAPIYQGVIIDITEQHVAADEVRAAERRWRLLLEHLPIVAYQVSFDADGTASDRWVAGGIYQLAGVTALEWLADDNTWNDLVHEDDRATVLEAWETLKREQAPFDRQYRLRRRDGSIVWVHDRAVITERDGGRVVEGAFADVTARHDAETALGVAEDRFRTLVEQLPAITFIEEIDTGVVLYVSPQIEAVYGYTAEEWMADPTLWEQRLHPEDRARVVASNDAETGDDWSIDYRSMRKDGSVVWIHNDARLIRDHEGAPLYWQGVAYDITERMHAEERLRAAEERYRTLVEQLPVAIYTDAVDDLSTALYISPQYEQLTGYTPEQRLLDPDLWVKMLHPEDRDRVLARSVETNETGEPFDIEYRIVAADGRVVWVHDHAMQVHEHSGQARWHGVLQDITENRRSAEAIARRDAILEATSFAAERFLRAPSWQEHLPEVLARLGLAGEATRCAVFRNHSLPSDALGVSIVDAWLSDGHRLEDDSTLDGFPWISGGFDRWVTEMSAGRPIHGIVNTFPAAEREILEEGNLSIRSLVAIPIFVDNAWWGYISFDHVAEDRRWSEADVEALSLTASTIGAAIERERAIGRLDEAQALYRTLIEQLPAVTYIEELGSGDETYSSPQTEVLLGYASDEWGSHAQWVEAIHPEDRERVVAHDEKLGETGEPYRAEYRMLTKDGAVLWVRDEATLVYGADGTPRYWQGVRFDITAAKESEERLRDAEQRYRAIVEHVPAAIYLDRPDGGMETIYMSPQIADIAGVTPEEWVGDPTLWLRLMDPDDRPAVESSYARAIQDGEPWRAEYRVHTPDGRTVWIHDETTILSDQEGTPLFLQGVLFDITERKLAEQALRESERRERDAAERLRALDDMKNTFLAAVSHELRSPLTSILGLSLTLERAPDIDGTDRADLLTRLSANAKKLDRLLKDLLDIDRLNRGIVEPQYRITDVAALARRTVEHLDVLSDREVIVHADPVVIPIDAPKVERIVENLLTNAVRHTTPDRKIWLTVAPHEGGVRITVEDDGPGVPVDIRRAIFEPFHQGPTRSAHAPGTGIGLSLVARFAELHGGTAWVDERDGGGAAFHVVIPGVVPEQTVDADGSRHADVG